MDTFILDTNLFFNMAAGINMGKKTEDVVVGLTEKARILTKNKKAVFFMPPLAVDEFLSFFENKDQGFIKDFMAVINIESPDLTRALFPATVFYKLIEDIRARSYRGLNIAEEEIENSTRQSMGLKIEGKKEFQIKIGAFIKKFRERYRNATRAGFLDSVTDLDLIVLSKQKDGFLVSTDEGVLSWGRTFGVKEMPVSVFRKRLEDLLDH